MEANAAALVSVGINNGWCFLFGEEGGTK